jgi:hypothetical protein
MTTYSAPASSWPSHEPPSGWVLVFFFPALVMRAAAGAKLWREQP